MELTRKEFLQTVAGAAGAAALATPTATAAVKGKPKRGVSLYSYTGDFGITMTLEDCLAEIHEMGMGQEMGLEILADAHIEGYPNPSDAWVKNWWALMKKYAIRPVEYGHWIDAKLYKGRNLTAKECQPQLTRDIQLANKLGFTIGRTKIPAGRTGGGGRNFEPAPNWTEIIEMALPVAEKNNFKMCTEWHGPTDLKSKVVNDFAAWIDKTKTKYFGFNIDFSCFQTRPRRDRKEENFAPGNKAEDMVPLLPYTYCCHAKFWDMTDDLTEYSIPYDEIISVLVKNGWDGYMLSEYEGARDLYRASDQLRKNHILMRKCLGET